MTRRNDTSLIGGLAEAEAARLLQQHGWSVVNLNDEMRNHRLYDLRAMRGNEELWISVKHARAKRHVRLGKPAIFRELRDEDFLIIFLPKAHGRETDIVARDYDVWIVPGTARHIPLQAHLHYYGGDEVVALAQTNMMIKDKVDRPGGRSISGAAFQAWESSYKDAWHQLG